MKNLGYAVLGTMYWNKPPGGALVVAIVTQLIMLVDDWTL